MSHSGGHSVAIGISSPSIPPPSPSLISLLVSVAVKHHVYFTYFNPLTVMSVKNDP